MEASSTPDDHEDILELQRTAQSGSLEAFGLLVDRYQSRIRAFVAARIDDPFEAQDIAQETFLIAYNKLSEIDASRPIRPWLCTIAANLVRNHRRRKATRLMETDSETVLDLLQSEIEQLSPAWQDSPLLEALEHCLNKVEEAPRQLLRLRYEEGLAISEIRQSVGGNHSAVTMKLHRLREQLRNCIERQIGEVAHG